jgi:hypothetical protein
MIRQRFAIHRRFALKDLLITTAVIAIALAWYLDRSRLASQIESLLSEVKSDKAEIQVLTESRDQLRKTVNLNQTQLREMRLNLNSLIRDVEAFSHDIDLVTLVSGVEAIESRGSFRDTVFVTFTNGQSFFRHAEMREASRAKRLLIRTGMR